MGRSKTSFPLQNGLVLGSLVAMALAFVAPAIGATRVPIAVSRCSLENFGSGDPTGLTYNTSTGELVMTDDSNDVAYFIDEECTASGTFSTGALGANSPQGIAYNVPDDNYLVVDSVDVEAYFTNTIGLYQGQCDLAALGALAPRGATYDPTADVFAIVDRNTDEVYVIDDSEQGSGTCNLIAQFAIDSFSTMPEAIAYVADSGRYATVDTDADEVFLSSATFQLEDQFDTIQGFGVGTAEGMVYVAETEKYFLVDATTDVLVQIDARGTFSTACATSDLASDTPSGVAFRPDRNEIIFTDDTLDTVFIVDASTCNLVRQFDVSALGIADASGVAYLASTNQLVITDRTNDGIYFVGYDSELLEDSCDTTDIGLTGLRGVAVMDDLDRLAIADLKTEAVGQLDLGCQPLAQQSAAFLGIEDNSSDAEGITYQPGLARFLVADRSTDEVYVNSFEGFAERQFDLQNLGLTDTRGIAALPGGTGYLLADADLDLIVNFSLPVLNDAVALSGHYLNPNDIPFLIFERGEGRLTGTVQLASGDLPLFGQYDAATGAVTLAVETATGPRAFTGTASTDLETIAMPAPIGTLVRNR